jgi:hypothetical protein
MLSVIFFASSFCRKTAYIFYKIITTDSLDKNQDYFVKCALKSTLSGLTCFWKHFTPLYLAHLPFPKFLLVTIQTSIPYQASTFQTKKSNA